MANVSFNTYDYYNGGWVGGQNWGSGYFYVGAEGRSDNINNLVSINVSGASSSSPITSITVSVAVCITNNDNGASTRITGYLYDTYTASLKGSTATVPSGYVGYGTSSAITATSSGTLATFTISGLNITSNGYIYLKLYSSSSYLKQIYTGSGSISCTTGSSSGDDGGGGTTTYYYRAYDITTNTYLTSSTSTTSSSILRPTMSSTYTYLGFVTHSSYDRCISYYNSNGLEGSSDYCTIHNSTYPYIVFLYSSSGSSTSTTYYYRAYDIATGNYLTNTAATTSSSISKPSVSSSYTYIGYVTHTSFDACITFYNRSGVEGSTNSCSIHNSSYPYILFIYSSSGGGVVQEYSIVDQGVWEKTLSSKGGVSIGNYQVFRYSYTPTVSGTLTFSSTTASVDTVGWIHSSASCTIDADGQPLNGTHYIGSYTDDVSTNNFAFSATADLSANTTYYLFVCCHGGGSGTVTLNANFTRKGYTISDAGAWNTSSSSKSLNIDSYFTYRYSYTPSTNGTLTFYADTENIDTIGWISTYDNCSIEGYGRPLSSSYYIGTYTDDANGNAFSATADLTAGTTYYLYVDCYNGGTGSVNLFIDFTSPRPNNWSWTSTIAAGSPVKLTAAEWNSFTNRIKEFRVYAGLFTYDFTTAISGTTPIDYTICNQAHSAINTIPGHGAMPAELTEGGPLYASFFNGLKDALNAIP